MIQVSDEILKEIKKLSLNDLEDLLLSFGDYEAPVPTINEFLDGDKYLGPFFRGTLREYWRIVLNELYPNPYYSPYWLVNLAGCIGSGKCHAKGTKVVMADGSVKCVEDIAVGDCLMGPDSRPRVVQTTTVGRGQIYKVSPTKGDAWYCNEDHVLTVVSTRTSEVTDTPLKEYLKKTGGHNSHSKLFRVGVEFPDRSVQLDPYFLGLWLGDGNSNDQGIHTPDPEIVLEALRHYSLVNDKHIPNEYLVNSRENRLLLLAGLLDTEGYQLNGCYEIVTKYDKLKDGILYLCRSLGLAAYASVKAVKLKEWDEPREYWRISISGNTSMIPCRVKRKQADPRLQDKDALRTGFTVYQDRIDDYFGFELDGDGRYLLNDFTVTHNSTIACAGIAYDLLKLLHMASPQTTLGVIPTTKIIFSIFNVTLTLTTDVVWDKLTQIFTASPYFSSLMGPLRSRVKTRDTIFPKRIDFSMGSRVGHSLGKDVYCACLTGDTPVPLLDGTVEGMGRLVDRVNNGESLYCYSYDISSKSLIPNKIKKGLKRGKREVIKITFDNGQSVKCTPDHLLLSRGKKWVPAGEFRVGDRLLPFTVRESTRHRKRYLEWVSPDTKQREAVHRVVAEWKSKAGGFHVHHKDGNKKNNTPENLMWIDRRLHQSHHGSKNTLSNLANLEKARDWIYSSENRDHIKDAAKRFQSDEEYAPHREEHKKSMRKYYGSSRSHDRRERQRGVMQSAISDYWNNPIHEDKRKIGVVNNQRSKILKKNYKIYVETKEVVFKDRYLRYFSTREEYEFCIKTYNHVITSVEHLGTVDVYDLVMEDTNSPNFGLSCGIWAHNCLDEANFEIVDGQITKTFNSLLRRMESRFMKRGGGVPGKIWIVSSETEKFAAVNSIVEGYRGKKGILISKAPLWEVVPERYGSESFWVYTGSEVRSAEIITGSNLNLLKSEPDHCIEVPEEHRDSFVVDINQSLRDLAGVPTGSFYRLFRLKDRLIKSVCISPLFPDIITLDFDNDDDQIANYIKYEGYFDNPMSAGMPRFISIDIGISGDRLGIAAAHIERFQERTVRNLQMEEVTELIPVVNVEFAFAIEPSLGKQIPLWKIRAFINWLSTKNYIIDRITCDGYQSTDNLQMLNHEGYTATLLSVDKTPGPYFKLRSMIYEGRCSLPLNKLLSRELEELLVSPKGDKIDHPQDFNTDRSKPSKDIADAVAASVYSAMTEGNKNKLLYYQPSTTVENSEFMGTFWPGLTN